uniref:Uncharacterized protein n=1 Tax=Physcomitrium patens TaxID=3218 RepID=A9RSJ4_PHYPA|nr:hypothetical protein PHYPA_004554 [Physcomitrium patens]
MAMRTEHIPHSGGLLQGVVAISSRCAADLFEATACICVWVIRRCVTGLAGAYESMQRWRKHSLTTPLAGMWDIDAGLHGPAIRRAEIGDMFPPLVLEDGELATDV